MVINASTLVEFLCQCPVSPAQEAYSTLYSLTSVASAILTKVLSIQCC